MCDRRQSIVCCSTRSSFFTSNTNMSKMNPNLHPRSLIGSPRCRIAVFLAILQLLLLSPAQFPGTLSIAEAALSVSVSNATFAFGTTPANSWLTPQATVITNDGTAAENFAAKISQFIAGANSWALSTTANGVDVIRAQWSTTSSTGPWTDISTYDTDFTIATNVPVSGTVNFWLRILTPTSTASYGQYSSTLTLTASVF